MKPAFRSLQVLDQSKRVIDCRVCVSGGDGVANPEEFETRLMVDHGGLRLAGQQLVVVDDSAIT